MIELIKKSSEYKENDVDGSKFLENKNLINDDLDKFLSGKMKKGYKSSVTVLDNHYLFKEKEMFLLTAKKGQGKTTISQILQVIGSVSNGLIWAVCFKENSSWSMKLSYMNYYLGAYSRDVKSRNKAEFNKALEWVDKHFIFLNIESLKDGVDAVKYLIGDKQIDIHALVLDPVNSFKNGWQDSGNGYSDGTVSAIELLNFSKKYCSVHLSQHPNMTAQRQEGRVTSYQGEGGWFLNKASFAYVLHRERGSNINELIVEVVRNKHTGGSETELENPIIIEWYPTTVNIRYADGTGMVEDVIQKIKNGTVGEKENDNFFDSLPKIDLDSAF